MDKKTILGWLSLSKHLVRFGSIPVDERALAEMFSVTVRRFRARVWPLLEDRLV